MAAVTTATKRARGSAVKSAKPSNDAPTPAAAPAAPVPAAPVAPAASYVSRTQAAIAAAAASGAARGQSSFALFCAVNKPLLKEAHPEASAPEVVKLLSAQWKELGAEEKKAWVMQVGAHCMALNADCDCNSID